MVFRIFTISCLSLLSLGAIATDQGVLKKTNTLTVGATYSIVEKDALLEIEDRAKAVDWEKVYNKDPESWSAWQSIHLPSALEDKRRQHVPIYVLEQAVLNKDGSVLYPKGYRYNPLDYVNMPWRMVIINGDAHQLEWLEENIQETDQIYTAGGDPRSMGQYLNRPVYIVDENMKQRLSLQVVPSVIEQVGNELVIEEYYVPTP